nr:ArsA family ATPase [Candidatus Sigynarchaeota archaeon]
DKHLDWKELALPKLVMCSGKGGVGKTTVTAALASGRARSGKRVLVISVDPAHSLGDSLEMDLSDGCIHQVPGFATLLAQEPRIGPSSLNASNLEAIQCSIHDQESLPKLLGDMFLPVSEEMSIIQGIAMTWRTLREKKLTVDEIYVDGSPSGHMLRTLQFPFKMNEYLGKFAKIVDGFKRILVFDARKRDMLKKQALIAESFRAFMNVLSNPALATAVLVTIPETMALAETERTFNALGELGIRVTNLVINKIHDPGSSDGLPCPFCAERVKSEAAILQRIERRFGPIDLAITRVPLLDHEIKGPNALTEMEHYLLEPPCQPAQDFTVKASHY